MVNTLNPYFEIAIYLYDNTYHEKMEISENNNMITNSYERIKDNLYFMKV